MSTPHQARFEEGKSVDVPKYLRDHGNPEAAEKWEEMNEEYGDMLKTAKIPLRQQAGTRVVVNANPASRTLYSGGLPEDGTEGTVTPVSFGSTKRTWMAGPGGGLVYVKFDDGSFMGVSALDLDKAPAKKKAGLTTHLENPEKKGYALCGERLDPKTTVDSYRTATCHYCVQAFKKSLDKKANMKKWDPRFFNETQARELGDRRFNYLPFHELQPAVQAQARRMYPHKSVGAMYDFIDEHYYYPVDHAGRLGKGRRVLAIPLKLIQDADFMASLGYTMNPGWPKAGAVNWKLACGDELMGRFEEGKPADPTENMSPEDKKRWWEEHAKNKDMLKSAADFRRKFATVRRAMEHPSDEARKKYLHEHPGADPKNHTVKKDEGGKGEKKDDEGGDSKPVSMSREGYKAVAEALEGFEAPGAWGHVISYAISGKPMEAKHVKSVVKDIDSHLKNWKQVSSANGWTPKDKKNLTRAKGILENWAGGGSGKQANEFLALLAEGCPDNLDESECKEWELNTLKYKDVVKDKSALDELAALDLDLTELTLPGASLDRSLRAMEQAAVLAAVEQTANSMVGQVILQQMGGLRRLSAMLGIYYLQYLPNGVEFGWPSRTPTKGNHVKVTLLPSDTYRVEFFKTSWTDLGRGTKLPATSKLLKKLDDIYAEDLVDIFERQTGWYLRLGSADVEALAELRALTADFDGEKRTDEGWDPGHMVNNPKAVQSTEGSQIPDGEGNKAKRAANVIDMMWVLVTPDHYVLGATDNFGDARSKSYWRAFVDDEQVGDGQLLTLESVPERTAEKLMDLGTPAQMYYDGYEAWRDVKPHVTGRPVRLAAEAETKEAATGLYGHPRRVQSDCEACIRKVQRTANSIARRIYSKDERVSQFLATHSKRANSLSAKILIRGMEGLGPKFASTEEHNPRLAELRAARALKTAGKLDLGILPANDYWIVPFTHGGRPNAPAIATGTAVAMRRAKEVSKMSGIDFVQVHDSLGSLLATVENGNLKTGKLSDADTQHDKGIEKTEKEAKTAGAPEHGLYGYTDKTATLGLNACAELRAAAGRIATDLHRRRADRHGSITGFLKEHCKQAKCMYSQLLSDSYPAADTRLASGPDRAPRTVAEWLAIDL